MIRRCNGYFSEHICDEILVIVKESSPVQSSPMQLTDNNADINNLKKLQQSYHMEQNFINLEPVPSSEIHKFKTFFDNSDIVSLYSLVHKRISKELLPLPVKTFYFNIVNKNFEVYALYNGLYDDESTKIGLNYLSERNESKYSFFRKRDGIGKEDIEELNKDEQEEQEEINKFDNEKNIVIGRINGYINGTVIYINRIDAGYMPKYGGQHMICSFIYYLQYLSSKYNTDTEFSVQLYPEPQVRVAYLKMGFEPIKQPADKPKDYITKNSTFYNKCNALNHQSIQYIDNNIMESV